MNVLGPISFREDLSLCGVKGCNKEIVMISTLGIDWFYEINEDGLCIHRHDLPPHKILKNPKIPKEEEGSKESFSHMTVDLCHFNK